MFFSTANTKYESEEDLINKKQSLKGKSKIKFDQKTSNFNDEKNCRR